MDAIPDFTIGPIHWHPQAIPELFGFLKLLKFEIVAPPIETEDAWLYIPYSSPHHLNPYYSEIIAPDLKVELARANECRLCLAAKRVIG